MHDSDNKNKLSKNPYCLIEQTHETQIQRNQNFIPSRNNPTANTGSSQGIKPLTKQFQEESKDAQPTFGVAAGDKGSETDDMEIDPPNNKLIEHESFVDDNPEVTENLMPESTDSNRNQSNQIDQILDEEAQFLTSHSQNY